MPSRRTFLMTALSAVAVGFTALVTSLLRRKPETGSQSTATQISSKTSTHPLTQVPAGVTQPTVPSPASHCPPIISRKEWGALDPNLEASGEHGVYHPVTNPDGWLVYDQPLEKIYHTIIIHHSALPLTDGPREIQALHMHDKGFADVGYQYMIDDAGKLYEGRAMNVRGAHTYGHNYGTIGICLFGNFEESQPTEAQLLTLRSLMGCLINQYQNIHILAGHRDYNPDLTRCPGDHLEALLPQFAEEQGLKLATG